MKKLSLALVLIGLTAVFSACGDNDKKSFCDKGFVDGCENGSYLYCEFEGTDKEGQVVSKETVMFNNIEYVCDSNDQLVPKDYECKNGNMLFEGKSVEKNVLCDKDNNLLFCNGDELAQGTQICLSEKMVECVKGEVKSSSCKEGLTCVDYERGDSFYATCIQSEEVKSGCEEGVTAYGHCENDGSLLFCTRQDASKGKTVKLNCPERSQTCMFIEDDFGYDCSETCEDGDKLYNEHGTCEDNKLVYCGRLTSEDAISKFEWDCAAEGKTCGFDKYQFSCK